MLGTMTGTGTECGTMLGTMYGDDDWYKDEWWYDALCEQLLVR